jgi:O-succinylbenzoic acid--CoA ligase
VARRGADVIVPDWLNRQAAARPHQPAIVTRGRITTWAALEGRVARAVVALGAAGIGPGARVATLLPNGLALVTLIHAAPRAGAALVPLDPHAPAAEVARIVSVTRPGLVVVERTRASAARAAADRARVSVEDLFDVDQPANDPAPRLDLEAPHTIIGTSGTTGEPKAVVLTAANHLWSALGSGARLGACPGDRWLACLPLWHVGGLAIVLRSAIFGFGVVLEPGFQLEAVARALAHDGVTMISLVPTALGRLLSARVPPPPSLRCALIGGAAAAAALLARAQAAGWPVAPTYGATEAASQIATAAPDDAAILHGSVGHPLWPTRVRILRTDGSEATPDESGQIAVQGPTVARGYLRRDQRIARVTVDGWLRTGDLGRRAADGTLTVLGRSDERIITGGENVAPAEVEAVLQQLPGVAEVAVAGIPDPEWGQAVTAWIVPRPGAALTLDGLRAAARAHLAPYKLPRRLVLVDALPRAASGKVRRRALRT